MPSCVCVFVACKVVKSRLSLLLWKLISWKALDLLSTFNANYFLHHKNRLVLCEKIAHWIISCYFFFSFKYVQNQLNEKKILWDSRFNVCKVEIFLEQREVVFLSPSKILNYLKNPKFWRLII